MPLAFDALDPVRGDGGTPRMAWQRGGMDAPVCANSGHARHRLSRAGIAQPFDSRLKAFRRAADAGASRGPHVAIDYRWAEGRTTVAPPWQLISPAGKSLFSSRRRCTAALAAIARRRRHHCLRNGATPSRVVCVDSPVPPVQSHWCIEFERGSLAEAAEFMHDLRPAASSFAVADNPTTRPRLTGAEPTDAAEALGVGSMS
jgi:putative ABC transport system substrate-binding protein